MMTAKLLLNSRQNSVRAIRLLDTCLAPEVVQAVLSLTRASDTARRRIRVSVDADPARIRAYAVGQRIRELRLRAGLRQEDVSAGTGIARANIARLEHGKHMPSTTSLTKIARMLGVALAELLAPPTAGRASDEDLELSESGLKDFDEALEREDRRR